MQIFLWIFFYHSFYFSFFCFPIVFSSFFIQWVEIWCLTCFSDLCRIKSQQVSWVTAEEGWMHPAARRRLKRHHTQSSDFLFAGCNILPSLCRSRGCVEGCLHSVNEWDIWCLLQTEDGQIWPNLWLLPVRTAAPVSPLTSTSLTPLIVLAFAVHLHQFSQSEVWLCSWMMRWSLKKVFNDAICFTENTLATW